MQKTLHIQFNSITVNGEVMYLQWTLFEQTPNPVSMTNDCMFIFRLHAQARKLTGYKIVSVQSASFFTQI